ncbi:MAG: phosphodiester glycosidase family protein [Verrucomicrobiae bacterium]|nr:phosphodiester glycosidase family protein [Verrucomicrobiae bacterium]
MDALRRAGIVLFLGLAAHLAPASAADWSFEVRNRASLPGGAGEYRRVSLTRGDSAYDADVLILKAGRYAARLADQLPGHAVSVADVVSSSKAFAGVNGGFFTESFQPDGLYVVDGKLLSKPLNASILSGVLAIDREGRIRIGPRGTSYAKSKYAFQAGPMLLHPGGVAGVSRKSTALARRTAIAIGKSDELIVLASSAVSLHDLAESLATLPNAFGADEIDRALNLDGGSSTAMSAEVPGKPVHVREWGRVRTVVLFDLK